MRLIKTTLFAIALGALVLASTTGCETVKGFGKDIQGASESVQEAFVN